MHQKIWLLGPALGAVASFAHASGPPTNINLPGSAYVRLDDHGRSPAAPGVAKPARMSSALADSLHLVEVAHLPQALDQALAFGDSDHDGQNEVGLYRNDSGLFRYHILEEQGGDNYTTEYIGASLIPYAMDDLDRDGKAELIGQWGYQILVYESPDAASYPSELVWASPNLSNVVGFTTTGDTDLDGKREIIHSVNSFGSTAYLYIYENVGDNAFALIYSLQVSSGAIGEKAIGDLDYNGFPEIAFAGSEGRVYVVESTGDNAWEVKWSTASGLNTAYGVEIGPDVDGNGKRELFVFGYMRGVGWTTIIYEPTGAGQFAPVATLSQYDGWSGMTCNALGDLTGTGRYQYAMQGYCCLWVYEATAPGQWTVVSELGNPEGQWVGLYAVDLNHNGRAEIVWCSEAESTLVLEHPPMPTVPVMVNDLQAEALPGKMRLTWSLAEGRSSLVGVDVERAAAPEGPYARLTPRVLEPGATMEYEDPGVEPGVDYWYRVVLIEPEGTRSFSSPVGVTFVGWPGETALLAPWQPSRDLVQFRYTIGGPEVAVKLQIFDVAGRLLATIDQGARGRGDYVQPWGRLDASGRTVARGLYIARLLAGQERPTRKFLLAR